MRNFLLSIVLSLFFVSCTQGADDFVQKFNEIEQTGDDERIQEFLEAAADSERDNPEYYASAANYWWQLGQKVYISRKPAEKGDIRLERPGKEMGSITQLGKAHPEIPEKALSLLIQGSRKFPFRADIALGLAHVQMEMERYDDCVATLETLLKTASPNPEKLEWKYGSRLPEEASKFIPETLHEYTAYYYNRATQEDDQRCQHLCKATIQAFPEHPYAYNMLAALANAQKDFNESLKYLLDAHKRAPKDPLILINLGDTYVKVGQKQKAMEAFDKVINSGAGEDYKEIARRKLKDIK